MDVRKVTNETMLYTLAFALALFSRLLLLGTQPLSDVESGWALQALGIARGQDIFVGPNPGYILLTGFLFDLFGSGSLLARLIPALAGSVLVFAPFLVRDVLGRKPALLLAFALAIDPGLLALSRQAGGTIFAVAMAVLAVSAWIAHRPRLAGVFAGLALLGGPAVWPGLLGLILTGLVGRWLWNGRDKAAMAEEGTITESTDNELAVGPGPAFSGLVRSFLVLVLVIFLTVGTLFFRQPQGLSATVDSLVRYVQSWAQPGTLPAGWWFVMLLAYHPIPLLFGVVGIGRGIFLGLRIERWLTLWAAISLLIAVFNPARQPADLVWVLIPLWTAAAREIARHLRIGDEEPFPMLGQGALTLIVLIFLGMNISSMIQRVQNTLPNPAMYILVPVGAVVLLFASGYLIAWGWSIRASLRGSIWGLLAALALCTVAAGSYAGGYRLQTTPELWNTGPAVDQVDLMVNTAADLSEWRFTRRDAIDLSVSGVNSPALQWAFRNYPQARFVNYLEANTMPSVVITPREEQPALTAEYRGQDFILSEMPDWSNLSPTQWLEWLVYRTAPTSNSQVILWARTDLFPAGNESASLDDLP